jgi:hypothetical protein
MMPSGRNLASHRFGEQGRPHFTPELMRRVFRGTLGTISFDSPSWLTTAGVNAVQLDTNGHFSGCQYHVTRGCYYGREPNRQDAA